MSDDVEALRQECLAYAETTRKQALELVQLARGTASEQAAWRFLREAHRFKMRLLKFSDENSNVAIDPDCHWDGTKRQPGEKRLIKGEPIPGFDLPELNQNYSDKPGEDPPAFE